MPAIDEKRARIKKMLKQVLFLGVAIALLGFAFKGINASDIWFHAQNVKPLPLILTLISGILGNFLRSYRWTILLTPLSKSKISQFNSFYAVSIGYVVNMVLPRGGEVARLVSICQSEKLPWAGVLSTMLIDRLLDVGFLVALLGATLLILPPELLTTMPWLKTGGLALLAGVVAGLVLLPFVDTLLKKLLVLGLLKNKFSGSSKEKLFALAQQFDTGTKSLKSLSLYPYIAVLSAIIWFSYWLNFYLMVLGFGLEDSIDAVKCLIIFTIGSVGSLIPTPSSAGGFHLLVKEATVATAHIAPAQALAFATVLHFMVMIAVSLIPAVVLFVYKRIEDQS